MGWKKSNKTFSYYSGCLAVIIKLLFNSLEALRLWHWRKKFALLCIPKWLRSETIECKFRHFFVRDIKWGRKPCQDVPNNLLRDQEAHGRWRRCQQTHRQWSNYCCGSWQLASCHSRNCFACGVLFEGQLAGCHLKSHWRTWTITVASARDVYLRQAYT